MLFDLIKVWSLGGIFDKQFLQEIQQSCAQEKKILELCIYYFLEYLP
jgi:hypothetical protein